MKHKLLYIIAILITLMIMFSANIYADTATVNTETLNLRKEASTSSSIVELLNMNTELEIIEESGDWYKVKHGNNTGYVKKEYVKVKETTENNTNPTTEEVSNTVTEETTGKSIIKVKSKLRFIPSINANIIENIEANEEITIISKTNKWAFIDYKDVTGWVPLNNIGQSTGAEQIKEGTPSEVPEENKEDNNNTSNVENTENKDTSVTYEKTSTKYVNTTSVYVREKSTTDSKILTTLIKNTDVIVTGEENDWYKVKYDTMTGYIRKDLLSDSKQEATSRSSLPRVTTETETTSMGQEIVDYAKQYLGYPYVYGGSGSSSFDCSGFTMYVYKKFGYSLSHSATAQSKCGEYVAKEDLQAGDLVFFLDYETMDGIGHCGIYIGDGNFIHASSGTGYCVKISTLLSGSYNKRYATARRLI